MTKRERLEDLGILNVKLLYMIELIEERWGQYLDSKHSLESFHNHLLEEEGNNLDDLHMFLRNHIEDLHELWAITKGDEDGFVD